MDQTTVSVGAVGALRAPAAPTRRRLRWCRDRSPLVAALVFFAAIFWPFVRKGDEGEWRRCFLRAAYRLEDCEIIHRPDEPNTYAYPPAMAMLAVPLAKLPFRWSLIAWYFVNVAAMLAAIVGAWRLTGGPKLSYLASPWNCTFWLGLFLASRFLVAPLENQQFDVVITACLFAGCMALWRGHDTAAGIWLGAAAAMKCTPLLFVPYLLWRGKARSAALLMLAAVLLNRMPDFLWPRPDGGSYLGDWIGTFLIKVGRAPPGVWDSDLILNQSLSGLINRLVQSGLPLSVSQLPSALASLPPETIAAIRLLVYGVSAALVTMTAWCFGCPGKPAAIVDGGTKSPAWSNLQTGIEAASLASLMLLLSPMSSKAHYVVLVLPCLLAARGIVERHLSWQCWLPPLFLLGPLTAKAVTGKAVGDLLLAWGFPTWFALLMLLAMCRLRRQVGGSALQLREQWAYYVRRASLRGSITTQGADKDGATFDERNDDLPLVV